MHHHAIGVIRMHILRSSDVTKLTGLSRTTLWRLESNGEFPPRVRLGLNSVGWRKDEVDNWIDHRPRGMSLPSEPSRSQAKDDGIRNERTE